MFSFRDYDLPLNRELCSSLQCIKGVGWRKAFYITSKFGFAYPFFTSNLNFYRFYLLSFLLRYLMASEVKSKRFISNNIRVMIELQSYRGLRHRDFLPVRGQRSRTNAGVQKRRRFSKDTFTF
jgi:small subunit ribosomal protein S13